MELALLEEAYSFTRLRAVQDAIEMQDLAVRQSFDAGIEIPPYKLMELIGKGSFGRVYKALATKTNQLVAVKIMSIEEGDCLSPGQSDTFAEILKEVSTLRILNDGGAKNINTIIDSILVGHSMWIITEFCAGGSVATLMRPTGFLPEMCIIPILREVAEAIFWVHKQGIIHRDIKCANVLVTEQGGVQLCDFGVAGIIRSKLDKRTTITGTLQWMAPELFDSNVTYGSEVDIWAFGSLAFEAATGFPPNATTLLDMDLTRFGAYLRKSCPRLEGDEYSDQLKDFIAFCMAPDPAKRPRIQDVQNHPYILDSATNFPSTSLSELVRKYKSWERKGGERRSLFVPGGAQCHARRRSVSTEHEGWDYGIMDEADQLVFKPDTTAISNSASRPPSTRQQRHRRLPPQEIKAVRAPLEKVFDPNTVTNYHDQVDVFYHRQSPRDPDSLPIASTTQPNMTPTIIKDTSNGMTLHESPIRIGAPLGENQSGFPQTPSGDLSTIKPMSQSVSSDLSQLQLQFGTCRTQDWTFPSMSHAPGTPSKPNHHRKRSSVYSFTVPSRSRSSSATFSIKLSQSPAGMESLDTRVSPMMTQIDDPLPACRGLRSNGFTISSRISLIDLDASLVSLSPPGKTLASWNHNGFMAASDTESFPSLTPISTQSSPSLPSLLSSLSSPFSSSSPSYNNRNTKFHLSSSTSILRSPVSPPTNTTTSSPLSPKPTTTATATSFAHDYDPDYYHQNPYYRAPSPLLPSPPPNNANERPAPPPPMTVQKKHYYPHHHHHHHHRHRRSDSGYYAASSSSASASVSASARRSRARTNNSSFSSTREGSSSTFASLSGYSSSCSSCCATTTTTTTTLGGGPPPPHDTCNDNGGRCQCPTIDETLALDETPPRYGYRYLSKRWKYRDDKVEQHSDIDADSVIASGVVVGGDGSGGCVGGRQMLRREPSLYLLWEGDGDGDDEKGQYGDRSGGRNDDDSEKGMFLPRIILGSKTTGDESLDFGSPTKGVAAASKVRAVSSAKMCGNMRPGSIQSGVRGEGNGEGGTVQSQGQRCIRGPLLPQPPKPDVILGVASKEALRDELQRLLGSMSAHLQHSADVMASLSVITAQGALVVGKSVVGGG